MTLETPPDASVYSWVSPDVQGVRSSYVNVESLRATGSAVDALEDKWQVVSSQDRYSLHFFSISNCARTYTSMITA
jgi:hypothetical protein